MNNILLQDNIFKCKRKQVIKNCLEINKMDETEPIMLLEGTKAAIRRGIMSYASLKKKEKEKEVLELVREHKVTEDSVWMNQNKHARPELYNWLMEMVEKSDIYQTEIFQ